MIKGIGTDIIEIDRFEKLIKTNFIAKYFTKEEINLFNKRKLNPSVIAANFAVKEAVSKAFGTGIRNFELKDIEVLRDEKGAPYINIYGNAKKIEESKKIKYWHVTISHSKENAVAFVVAEGEISQ